MGEIVTFEGKSNMTAVEVKGQVQLIQQILATVMKEGEHYGVVPGCGTKKVLLKSGAEKIAMTFRLGCEFDEMPGSVESDSLICYKINCKLIHIPTGNTVGNGRGTCNSKEKKYATRSVYSNKATDEEKAIGKLETRTGRTGTAEVYVIPNNPWDVQNTIMKMACKRAMVAAILNATAASDLFTQDLEDLPEGTVVDENGTSAPASSKPATQPPQRTQTPPPQQHQAPSGDVISENQGKRFYAIAKGKGMTDQEMKDLLMFECNIEHSRDIPREQYDAVIDAVQNWKKA